MPTVIGHHDISKDKDHWLSSPKRAEVFGDGADPRDRIHAAVGERRADEREIAAGDEDGALPEIGFQRRRRLVGEDIEVAQHPANRTIAMARLALGLVDLLVDIERKYAGKLTFRPDPTYHHEKFSLHDANTGAELKIT